MNAVERSNAIRLRVLASEANDVGRGIARVAPHTMSQLGLRSGDHVAIRGERTAVARILPVAVRDPLANVVHLDGLLRRSANCQLSSTVTIAPVQVAQAVSVQLCPLGAVPSPRDVPYIKSLLEGVPVVNGTFIRATLFGNDSIDFEVLSTTPESPVSIGPSTEILVQRPQNLRDSNSPSYEDIGGIRGQLDRIREMIELPLRFPEIFESLGIDPPRGILLYGPPGCGKTLIARTIAQETSAKFFTISGPEVIHKFYGESEAHLRRIFSDAAKSAPSIIFLDEIDAIAPHRETAAGDVERRVVAQLLALMDGLNRRNNVIVIAATNLPNAIDPALRRPGRFDREIEIPVPDRSDRESILSIHSRGIPKTADVDLKRLAEITHGFVGADLESLCREAAMNCVRRVLVEIDFSQKRIPYDQLARLNVSMDDFLQALHAITPSAIREVFVEVPNVRWQDVGGLNQIKQALSEAVIWPLKYPETFRKAGIQPAKGILLAGPPGVGKTLVAKALATESSVNFISVKGPELISKFVGDSEKAIRNVFERARRAAPCIIFFDELDGLLSSRSELNSDSGVATRVLSQFLSEMDGIDELKGVFVLAATNRPDLIDPAARRYGRFERTIHIGLPDTNARKEIISVLTRAKPFEEGALNDWLERETEGMTGADIAGVLELAVRRSLRERLMHDPASDDNEHTLIISMEDAKIALKEFLAEYRKG